jgi:hypothetical protein
MSAASAPVTATHTRGGRREIMREIKLLGAAVMVLNESARYYRRVIADATTDYQFMSQTFYVSAMTPA